MVKKIVLSLCVTLFLCGCSRSGPQNAPEQDTAPSRHYTGYYYA